MTINVVVIGCGNMGSSHARAYHRLDGFKLVGLVDRSPEARARLSRELGGVPEFDSVDDALAATQPRAVAVCTYPETHRDLTIRVLKEGMHVFVEKPLALTVEQASEIAMMAHQTGKKVVVGYILRHHPAWIRFIETARTLGKPLVMRMNLNQQSKGAEWEVHKKLMNSMSPIVDCGVHYVDVMCQMTRSRPVRVHAIGARLTGEVATDMYNYGQLQVTFADGSVGSDDERIGVRREGGDRAVRLREHRRSEKRQLIRRHQCSHQDKFSRPAFLRTRCKRRVCPQEPGDRHSRRT
jgi:predicted dehydrogenase